MECQKHTPIKEYRKYKVFKLINMPEKSLKKSKQNKPVTLDCLIKDYEKKRLQELSNCKKIGTFTMPESVEKCGAYADSL